MTQDAAVVRAIISSLEEECSSDDCLSSSSSKKVHVWQLRRVDGPSCSTLE